VLLRYLLEDDADQSSKATRLITNEQEVLITDVVLIEAILILKGKKYQLNKSELVAVIQALFQEPNIQFEDGQVVWQALNDYWKAKPVKGKEADFADALIVNKARYITSKQGQTFNGLYTFDLAAQKLSGAKIP